MGAIKAGQNRAKKFSSMSRTGIFLKSARYLYNALFPPSPFLLLYLLFSFSSIFSISFFYLKSQLFLFDWMMIESTLQSHRTGAGFWNVWRGATTGIQFFFSFSLLLLYVSLMLSVAPSCFSRLLCVCVCVVCVFHSIAPKSQLRVFEAVAFYLPLWIHSTPFSLITTTATNVYTHTHTLSLLALLRYFLLLFVIAYILEV